MQPIFEEIWFRFGEAEKEARLLGQALAYFKSRAPAESAPEWKYRFIRVWRGSISGDGIGPLRRDKAMRDVELYQQLLGLVAPWTVGRVELSVESERGDIWAAHAPEVRWPCPECGTLLPVYDHSEE